LWNETAGLGQLRFFAVRCQWFSLSVESGHCDVCFRADDFEVAGWECPQRSGRKSCVESEETGFDYELDIPINYDDLLAKFGKGQIDLAYFGGVTFVKANSEHHAIPLVMRDVDSRFTSVFIVAGDNATSFRELQGKTLGFGSQLSTSGHLMPRYYMQRELGAAAEDYFSSVQYSGKHDRTAYWVRDGEIDVGAANSEIIPKMSADGRLRSGDVRVIWTTPPFADYVWAAHPQISDAFRQSIQQAFLKLSVSNPQHEAILLNLGATVFYPAAEKDFVLLKQILVSSGVK